MVNHCSTTIMIDGYSSNDLLLPAVNFQISVRWARVWVAWDRVRNECVIMNHDGTITMQYKSFFFCILAGLIIWYYCTYTFEQEELRNPLFSLTVLASGRLNGENSMHEAYWHWKLKKQTLIAKITMYVNDIDGTRCLKAKAASYSSFHKPCPSRVVEFFFSEGIAIRLRSLFSPSAASFHSAHTLAGIGVPFGCFAGVRWPGKKKMMNNTHRTRFSKRAVMYTRPIKPCMLIIAPE